jgi:hypothetical protein
MILAAITIFFMEIGALWWLEQKYCREDETTISIDEFITRATLDDILRHRHHAISAWIALGTAAIASIVRT